MATGRSAPPRPVQNTIADAPNANELETFYLCSGKLTQAKDCAARIRRSAFSLREVEMPWEYLSTKPLDVRFLFVAGYLEHRKMIMGKRLVDLNCGTARLL